MKLKQISYSSNFFLLNEVDFFCKFLLIKTYLQELSIPFLFSSFSRFHFIVSVDLSKNLNLKFLQFSHFLFQRHFSSLVKYWRVSARLVVWLDQFLLQEKELHYSQELMKMILVLVLERSYEQLVPDCKWKKSRRKWMVTKW